MPRNKSHFLIWILLILFSGRNVLCFKDESISFIARRQQKYKAQSAYKRKKVLLFIGLTYATTKLFYIFGKGNSLTLRKNDRKYFINFFSSHAFHEADISKAIEKDLCVLGRGINGSKDADFILDVAALVDDYELYRYRKSYFDIKRKFQLCLSLYEQGFKRISKRYCKLMNKKEDNISLTFNSELGKHKTTLWKPSVLSDKLEKEQDIKALFNIREPDDMINFFKIANLMYFSLQGNINAGKMLDLYIPDAIYYYENNKISTYEAEKIQGVLFQQTSFWQRPKEYFLYFFNPLQW